MVSAPGAITGQTTREKPAAENTFLIWNNGQPGNFEMRCSFKSLPERRGLRQFGRAIPQQSGQALLLGGGRLPGRHGGGAGLHGRIYEERGRGSAIRGQKVLIHADGKKEITGWLGGAAELEKEIRKGEWNDYVIKAEGNHLQQFINGKKMIDVVDEQSDKVASSGIIALQLHQATR